MTDKKKYTKLIKQAYKEFDKMGCQADSEDIWSAVLFDLEESGITITPEIDEAVWQEVTGEDEED